MTFQSDNGKAFVGELRRELMKRSHIAQALDDLPPTDEWTCGKEKNDTSERAQRILLEVHDRLGQVLAASGASTQHHTTQDNGDQSIHDADRQRKGNAVDILLPRIRGAKAFTPGLREGGNQKATREELNEMCRRNTAQVQMRQRKKHGEKTLQAKPCTVRQYVWVFQKIIPPKGTKKLLNKWRGPFRMTEVTSKVGSIA